MRKLLLLSLLGLLLFLSCNSKGGRGREDVTSEVAYVDIEGDIEEVVADTLKPIDKPTVKVYIENSGSMNGYVKGTTEFEQALYNYLTDIKISSITDSLSLFYINSEIIPQGSNLSDFIEKLEPASFQAKGGNLGSSDIANVIESVIQDTDDGEIAMMVTDGIFSPGRGVNAENYLVNQQIGIKRIFADYLKRNKDAGLIVYKLESQFSGVFYDKVDNRSQINENRPYYVWIIGDVDDLCELRNRVGEKKLKERSAQNQLEIFTAMNGLQTIKYAINPSIGAFDKKGISNNVIRKLKKTKRSNKAEFAINVDFSNLLLDNEYLMNVDNYDNNSNYDLEIKEAKSGGGKYTHTLYFSSDKISLGDISVTLKSYSPSWVESSNDDEGNGAILGKTYGIKYQISGVYEAFTFDSNNYAEIKISVK